MPTAYQRIQVTKDEALSRALEDVQQATGRKPAGTLVRELALRGAEAVLAEERERRERLREAAEVLTSDDPPFNREVLARIDELAWGIPPDDR